MGVPLPSIMDIYTTCCIHKATNIIVDLSHPSHALLTLLPSGKRYRRICALTSRLCNIYIVAFTLCNIFVSQNVFTLRRRAFFDSMFYQKSITVFYSNFCVFFFLCLQAGVCSSGWKDLVLEAITEVLKMGSSPIALLFQALLQFSVKIGGR